MPPVKVADAPLPMLVPPTINVPLLLKGTKTLSESEPTFIVPALFSRPTAPVLKLMLESAFEKCRAARHIESGTGEVIDRPAIEDEIAPGKRFNVPLFSSAAG